MAEGDRTLLKALRRLSARGGSGAPLDRETARRLRARGLAAGDGDDALVLTEAGRSFLRRGLADREVFAAQHRTFDSIVIDSGAEGRRTVTVNAEESPLAALRRRRGRDGRPLIGAAEFAAGERLRADYARGRLMPRVTANWTAPVAQSRRDGAGGAAEITEAALAARLRVERALVAVGPDFAGLLVDVCCFLKGLEEIERERLWPQRSAKLVLRLALAALARYYGLAVTARGREGSAGIRHWGTEDFRPSMD